jgi:2'-5' RNA ligase
MSTGRYAVYFAPARDSAWHRFGRGWLGRDDCGNAPAAPQLLEPPLAQVNALTAEPRRYGFHATLKAPFRLRGDDVEVLKTRLARIAARWRPLPLGPLAPVHLDGFVALVRADPQPAVDALAAECVIELDDLRAPLQAAELARRQPERLDARGRELLERYGYPQVLERFRFHLTLTGPVQAPLAARLIAQLVPAVARLNSEAPLALDRLCLFHEPLPGAPFVRVHEVELRA